MIGNIQEQMFRNTPSNTDSLDQPASNRRDPLLHVCLSCPVSASPFTLLLTQSWFPSIPLVALASCFSHFTHRFSIFLCLSLLASPLPASVPPPSPSSPQIVSFPPTEGRDHLLSIEKCAQSNPFTVFTWATGRTSL